APGLGHDLVSLLLEGLPEVEPDDGLVLGDQNSCGHRSILISGARVGRAARPAWPRGWRSCRPPPGAAGPWRRRDAEPPALPCRPAAPQTRGPATGRRRPRHPGAGVARRSPAARPAGRGAVLRPRSGDVRPASDAPAGL